MLDEMLVDNSARRKRQKALDIRVIIGNPPYSAGQESANDNNANIEYPHLDTRIAKTYAANSKATLQNKLYDSYIRAYGKAQFEDALLNQSKPLSEYFWEHLSDDLNGAQWLGQSIESLADNEAVLVVGANLRKEQPLLTARLRRAAKERMALSALGSRLAIRLNRPRGITAPWRRMAVSATLMTLSSRSQERRPCSSQGPDPMSNHFSSSACSGLGEVMSPSTWSPVRPMTTRARSVNFGVVSSVVVVVSSLGSASWLGTQNHTTSPGSTWPSILGA